MTTTVTAGATPWIEGIGIIPGPTDSSGDGTHETDLTGYFSPDYAFIGVVGLLVVIVTTFIIAVRRRLRARKSRR